MGRQQYLRMFLKLSRDSDRWRTGLAPFPRVVPPPPPPSQERVKEIVEEVKRVRVESAATVGAGADKEERRS